MQEMLLLLLLTLAVASGWMLGRKQATKHAASTINTLPEAYYRGLNHLLNEQPEQAMELFMQALNDDAGAIDTHLTLGRLFRAKGDLIKATRVHQNLLARSNLESTQRISIQFELASDYMAAGLLDRAERILTELVVNGGATREQSLLLLLEVYQTEKDWRKAIDVAGHLLGAKTQDMTPIIAQYHCELAQRYYCNSQENKARYSLARALDYDRSCVRAYLQLAEMDIQDRNYKAAIKSLKKIKKQSPDYLREALPMLQSCYQQLGQQKKFYQYLLECLHDGFLVSSGFNGSQTLRKYCADPQQLNQVIQEQVTQAPSLQGLHYLLDLQMYDAVGNEILYLQKLRDFVEHLIANKATYCCKNCGYTSRQLDWHCPSCQHWGQIKPSQLTE